MVPVLDYTLVYEPANLENEFLKMFSQLQMKKNILGLVYRFQRAVKR
jgi:hypothetical protein